MPDPESIQQFSLPSPWVLFALIVFGIIGGVAFMYGWRRRKARALGFGLALCVYPYLTNNGWLIWLGGIGLTAALIMIRDE